MSTNTVSALVVEGQIRAPPVQLAREAHRPSPRRSRRPRPARRRRGAPTPPWNRRREVRGAVRQLGTSRVSSAPVAPAASSAPAPVAQSTSRLKRLCPGAEGARVRGGVGRGAGKPRRDVGRRPYSTATGRGTRPGRARSSSGTRRATPARGCSRADAHLKVRARRRHRRPARRAAGETPPRPSQSPRAKPPVATTQSSPSARAEPSLRDEPRESGVAVLPAAYTCRGDGRGGAASRQTRRRTRRRRRFVCGHVRDPRAGRRRRGRAAGLVAPEGLHQVPRWTCASRVASARGSDKAGPVARRASTARMYRSHKRELEARAPED